MRESRIGLRCVGLRLSHEPREAAQRRKKRTASKKQQQLQPDTLSSSALTLHEGGDGSADADRLVAGLFLARRGE
jgi:hypothetical protein